jgi:hypothetical protein
MKQSQSKHQPTSTRSLRKPARELVARELEHVAGGASSTEYALMLTIIL